jgi:hypothetical protein
LNLTDIAAHLEIKQVLYRYCRGVDRGDQALISSVYHDGATDVHGAWEGDGAGFAAYIVESLDQQSLPSQHHITNVLIELHGDRAAVESYFLAYHPYPDTASADERIAVVGGRYLDRFERRRNIWAIAHRQVVLDWSRAELPGETWSAVASNFAKSPSKSRG